MILTMILKTVFSIILISTVARFLAQMARADFYNPLAQTVVKITDPFLRPMRRVLPSVYGVDTSSLIVLFLGQLLLAILVVAVNAINPFDYLAQLIIWSVIAMAVLILSVIQWSMIIVGIASFILMGQYNPFIGFLTQMIEPFVGPFRRLNLQVGMLDLSFLIAFFVIFLIKQVILLQGAAQYVGFNYQLFVIL